MQQILELNERFGHLEVQSIDQIPVMLYNRIHKRSYDSGERETQYTLNCECGGQVKVLRKDFRGRKLMKHCRGKDCEFAIQDAMDKEEKRLESLKPKRSAGRPSKVDRGIVINLYVGTDTRELLMEYATKQGVSMSQAACKLIQAGMVHDMVCGGRGIGERISYPPFSAAPA